MNGSITMEEIKAVLGVEKDIPDEAFKSIVQEVDTNGDGEVSFEEFKHMLLRLSIPFAEDKDS